MLIKYSHKCSHLPTSHTQHDDSPPEHAHSGPDRHLNSYIAGLFDFPLYFSYSQCSAYVLQKVSIIRFPSAMTTGTRSAIELTVYCNMLSVKLLLIYRHLIVVIQNLKLCGSFIIMWESWYLISICIK